MPKPTWWQRQKKRLAYWWRRTRSRIACWVLGIDRPEVKMKGTIKSWESNIQGLCLTLDGDINLTEGGTFTHNEGTVTMTTFSNGPLYDVDGMNYTESDGTARALDMDTGKLKIEEVEQ